MDLNEEIAKVAYELYEKDGRQDGKDQEHWLEAERIVTARQAEKARAVKAREAVSGAKKEAPKAALPPKAPATAKKEERVPKPGVAASGEKAKKTTRKPRSK